MKHLNKRFLLAITIALLAGSIYSIIPSKATINLPVPKSDYPADQSIPATVEQLLEDGIRISYHSNTGKVRFIGAETTKPIRQPKALSPHASDTDAAIGFLSVYGDLFGISDPGSELEVIREQTLEKGRAITRFQQIYQGIPVLGGELIVQTDSADNLISASGEILPNISLATEPTLDSTDARQIALESVSKWHSIEANDLETTQPELWIFNLSLIKPGTGITHLVWRTEVSAVDYLPIRELVLVDAQQGSIVLHFNQIADAKSRQIYDNQNNPSYGLPGPNLARSEGEGETGITDVDLAYEYAGDTYDYYWNNHNRDSLDDSGMPLISTVRYCPSSISCPYQNAFWNGTQMVYGQGFVSADDVVGHEMTHGVTDFTSNLFYYYQSGAINESFSDLWGEFVDLANGKGNDGPNDRWLIGEDLQIGAIRSMKNPPAFNHPDKITSSYYYTGAEDNGGVHWNSGVNNKAVYLLTDGDVFNGKTVLGWERRKSQRSIMKPNPTCSLPVRITQICMMHYIRHV
jgi:bacillolysin